MERHQILYFLAVAKTKNFTKAALQCNVSQPSLSVQISKLEDELGGELFIRERLGCQLTHRGEVFLPRALEIVRQMDLAQSEMLELDGLQKGQLSLGCPPSTGTHILPKLISLYNKKFPNIHIKLHEESSPQLKNMLLENLIDLAFVDEAGIDDKLVFEKVLTENLFLVVPLDHPLAGLDEISIQELKSEPFIALKMGFGFRAIIERLFSIYEIAPPIIYESSGIETIQAMVETGIGVSIVPAMVKRPGQIKYIALTEDPKRNLYLAHKKRPFVEKAVSSMTAFITKNKGLLST